MNIVLDHLHKSEIIREMGKNSEMISDLINSKIALPKDSILKIVIYARYLRSISWPHESVGSLMSRLSGDNFTTSERLVLNVHSSTLTEESQQLTIFVKGSKLYTIKRSFSGLPKFVSRTMTIPFLPLIKCKQAVFYIDKTIMQAISTEEMFDIIKTYRAVNLNQN